MRQLKLLFFIISALFAVSVHADIQQRIAIFTQQSELFREICFTPGGVFLKDKILFDKSGSISETVIDCNAQALALEEEREAIEALLQNENCPDETVKDAGLIDLLNGTSGVVNEMACPGMGSARDCTEGLACNLLKSVIPMGAAAANFLFQDSPLLKSCSGTGSCLTNLGKAIWDNLWDTVTGLYDLGKMGLSWVGDKLGSLWNAEDQTSNRGIAATEISDSELDQFLADPVNYVYDFGKRFIHMITDGISKRYGCSEWTGAPHLSECLKPMSWECADCNDKLNMVCGVTGYIGANLITNFFTGGAAAAAQITSKIAATAVVRVARSIPGAARIAETMAQAGKLSRVGSLVSGSIKSVWLALKSSRTIQGISSIAKELKAAGVTANSMARKSVFLYAEGQDAIIAAAKAYNRLTIGAFQLGYRSTGRAANEARNFLYSQYPKLSDITGGRYTNVTTPEAYFREATKNMPAADRNSMRVSITTDANGERRVVIHDTRAGDIKSDLSYNFTPEPPPTRVVTVPPPVTIEPITVTARRTVQYSPQAAERLSLSRSDHIEALEDILGQRLTGNSGDVLISSFEKRASAGADPALFRAREEKVRQALITIGLSPDEAIRASEKLFRSGALGRTPPPSEIATIIRSPSVTVSFERRVQEAERTVITGPKDQYVNEWASRTITTPVQNEDYIRIAMRGQGPGLFFLDTQNTALKRLNDTIRDKSLVDALGNRYNFLVEEALAKFKEKYPNIVINTYSDYKSMRASIRGPPGRENALMNELAHLMDEVGEKFRGELKAQGFINESSIDERWFRAGLGRSADEANLVTRFSRRDSDIATTSFETSETQRRINSAWRDANLTRKQIERRFQGTPLLQSIEGSQFKVPTAEVLEVVRKNENANDIARILTGRLGTNVTERDARLLKKYFEQVDQFSPGLLIAQRVEHRFDEAVHGGLSIDFAGVGSVNAEATAIALAEGRTLSDSVTAIRRREVLVTEELDALKARTERAVREVFERNGMSAQITVSGDDMLVVPNKPMTPKIRRELALAQVRAQVGTATAPSGMRTSFFAEGIPEQASRSIQATIGETVEKKLRKRLEGILTPNELRETLFAIEMRGTSPGTGAVGMNMVNPNLPTRSRDIIEREFRLAIQDINQDLRQMGQTGELTP